MNSFKLNKTIVCSVLAIILLLGASVHSEPPKAGSDTLESIGKNDPFETVKPLVQAKKKLVEKFTGSRESEPMPEEVTPDLFLETIMLKFLQAINLERVVANLNTSYGTVSVNEETNSLIICDTRENLDKIVSEIRKADQTPKQILIEVVIADVQLENDTEMGVDWTQIFSQNEHYNYAQTLIPTTMETGGALSFIDGKIDITLKALQQVRNVEILANPRVLVVSGGEASIETVEEIPYIELTQSTGGSDADSGALASTEFKEAGIKLTVSAVITDDNQIMMTIAPEQSVNTGVAGVGSTTVPIVDKRMLSTTLLMKDGQIVVMGGLRTKSSTLTENKVPLLGDIPGLGFLFSNDKEVVKCTELLVFISPHIYTDTPLTPGQSEKYEELRNKPVLELPKRTINNPISVIKKPTSQCDRK